MIDDEELQGAAAEAVRTHLGDSVDATDFADAVLAIIALERDAESRQARKDAGLAD